MGSWGTADARFERWVQRLALLLGVPTRVVLFVAALFAIGDAVIALIARGQWLTKVGPVEVSERVGDVRTENQRLERWLEKSDETIDSMRHAAGEVNDLFDRMNQDTEGE
jgi:hypothetical protein